MSIQELKELQLHDTDLEKIQIDLTDKKISLGLSIYNEEREDYDLPAIHFTDVGQLMLSAIELADFDLNGLDIYSHDVSVDETGKPHISFILLTGHSKPSVQFSFSFSACEWADSLPV